MFELGLILNVWKGTVKIYNETHQITESNEIRDDLMMLHSIIQNLFIE